MKEIKFRAWLKTTNEMVDVKYIHFESKVIRYNDLKNKQIRCAGFEHIVLMQYTGLKDKNGKEIYEGDIVRYVFDNDGYIDTLIGVVIWEDTLFTVKVKTNCYYDLWKEHQNCYEIIGNIYENKELLEE